jgi:uncharacterized membrane protein
MDLDIIRSFDWVTLYDWVGLLVRWIHVIAGIAWIGTSFYFIALDASLRHNPRLPAGVSGDTWQVHGGGFYQMQKYTVAPEFLPEHLTWFKWEAYATWIFGFALLILVYYTNPSLYLIDTSVADILEWDAVGIGLGSLVLGWFAYDLLCRSWFGRETARLAISGFVLLVGMAWLYTHIFSGRGAFIQIGALVGSIMVGNVAIVIMPNQRKTVARLIAGQVPDAIWGKEAKQRSIHNNYLTLPVVFTMLSNHYAFTYQTKWNWLILACVFIAGFLIRHWYNIKHTGAKPDWRLWPAACVPLFAAMLLTLIGHEPAPIAATPVTFAEVRPIVDRRCHVCHAARPQFPGFAEAPKGIKFDSPTQIHNLAGQIFAQAVKTHTMPLNNVTQITDEERQILGSWITAGARVN